MIDDGLFERGHKCATLQENHSFYVKISMIIIKEQNATRRIRYRGVEKK